MKKILLLGGSSQQIIAIKRAKYLGYYTILCDYLGDNPGQYEANKFYLVSTTDKYTILKISQKEKIDGILIQKRRYLIPLTDKLTIELDVFEGELAPLQLAEVEFETKEEAEHFVPPAWFGEDVTFSSKYHNSTLSKH